MLESYVMCSYALSDRPSNQTKTLCSYPASNVSVLARGMDAVERAAVSVRLFLKLCGSHAPPDRPLRSSTKAPIWIEKIT